MKTFLNRRRFMKFTVEINDIVIKELAYFLDMDSVDALHEAIAKSLKNELDMDIDEVRQSVKVSHYKSGDGH